MEVHASFCLLYSSLHFPNTPESISMEANDAVHHWGIDVRDGGGLMSGTEVGWMDGWGGGWRTVVMELLIARERSYQKDTEEMLSMTGLNCLACVSDTLQWYFRENPQTGRSRESDTKKMDSKWQWGSFSWNSVICAPLVSPWLTLYCLFFPL